MGLQTKLKVNEPGDIYEQEADRIADHVFATPTHTGVSGSRLRIQRFSESSNGQADMLSASVDQALASPGRPLEPALRQDVEKRFGYDFSQVRVHTGEAAEQSARDVNAHAYTVGHDIVFGAGGFAPGSYDGRRLIAHELTHVVQQSGADGNRVRQNNENCGGSAISQPVVEGRAIARSVQRQPAHPGEIEMPAEYVFAFDERKRTDKNYAWSQGRKDAAQIQKSGKLSPEDKQEVIAKLRFFQGEAKAAYMRLIQPALVNYSQEVVEILQESASTGVGEHGTQKPTCDVAQHQFLLEYEDEPGKTRCMDIRTDPELKKDYFDSNIKDGKAYSVEATTWENVEYKRFKVLKVNYQKGKPEYFMLNDVGNFYYGNQTLTIREFTYLKRGTGLIYPVYQGRIYFNELLTPGILSLKNGLAYQVKDLQGLYTLLETAGAFASIISTNALVAGFKESLEGFRSMKSSRATTEPESPTSAPGKGTEEPSTSSTETRTDEPPVTSLKVEPRGPGAASIYDESFSANRKYGGSKKHTGKTRWVGGKEVSKEPTDGQAALDFSFPLEDPGRRIGIDVENNEFVVFDRTENLVKGKKVVGGIYHGHVREWDKLSAKMQKVLKPVVDKRGRIDRSKLMELEE